MFISITLTKLIGAYHHYKNKNFVPIVVKKARTICTTNSSPIPTAAMIQTAGKELSLTPTRPM